MAVLKMTHKHKLMAYVLYKNFGYTMTSIAALMQVAQSTVSASIKEVDLLNRIDNLEFELAEAKQELAVLGYKQNVVEILPPYNQNNF